MTRRIGAPLAIHHAAHTQFVELHGSDVSGIGVRASSRDQHRTLSRATTTHVTIHS